MLAQAQRSGPAGTEMPGMSGGWRDPLCYSTGRPEVQTRAHAVGFENLTPLMCRYLIHGFMLALFVGGTQAYGADLGRGKVLYQNHCRGCHESTAHIRVDRRATDLSELREWVARWALQIEMGWSQGQVDDVTGYLNDAYYRFKGSSSTR